MKEYNNRIDNKEPSWNFGPNKKNFKRVIDIINRLKKYDFPEPFMIDIITHDDVDFIIHFKSANWTNYDTNYLVNKKTAMIKLLTNDNN